MESDAKSTYEKIKRAIELRRLLKGKSLEKLSLGVNAELHSELMDLDYFIRNHKFTETEVLEIFDNTVPLEDYLELERNYEILEKDYNNLNESRKRDVRILDNIIKLTKLRK